MTPEAFNNALSDAQAVVAGHRAATAQERLLAEGLLHAHKAAAPATVSSVALRELLDPIRARHAATTQGRWLTDKFNEHNVLAGRHGSYPFQIAQFFDGALRNKIEAAANAAFAAEAHRDVPLLCTLVERQAARADAWFEFADALHKGDNHRLVAAGRAVSEDGTVRALLEVLATQDVNVPAPTEEARYRAHTRRKVAVVLHQHVDDVTVVWRSTDETLPSSVMEVEVREGLLTPTRAGWRRLNEAGVPLYSSSSKLNTPFFIHNVRPGDLWAYPAPSYDPTRAAGYFAVIALHGTTGVRGWYLCGDDPPKLIEQCGDILEGTATKVVSTAQLTEPGWRPGPPVDES